MKYKLAINLHSSKGFTLLELLVVMAIISILASISIPRFNDYRRRAFDTRALSDLRNVASAEEAYFLDNESYLSCQNNQCAELPGINNISKGVIINVSAEETAFTASASHEKGSGKEYQWDSEQGGLVE